MYKLRSFLRKKKLDSISNNNELERTLGAFQLVMLGIGAIVGAGIFVIIGPATGGHAGPAVTLSFILAALACACAGLCYAELASSIPVSGSAYSYLYVALGEVVAWIIAGMIFLTYFMGAATVASGWSSYMINFLGDFGIHFPMQFSDNYGQVVMLADGSNGTAFLDLPALLLVLAVTVVLYIGTNTSAIVNTVFVFVKMAVLIGFIVIGVTKIDVANWIPYIPENTGEFGKFGISGVISGASLVLFAYAGFDAVATAAQETKNPQRNLPIGILGSLSISAITYILIALVLTGVVSYKVLDNGQPIAIAVNTMGMPWFQTVIKLGAVIGLPSVVLVQLFGIIRILYTMTKDGLLPKALGKVSKKTHTPYVLTFTLGGLMALASAMVPLESLAKIANFGTSVTFTMVCFTTIYLRYTKPEMKRSFRVPLMPYIPLLGIVLFGQMILSLSLETMIFAAVWITILVLLYTFYGNKKSVLREAIK